MSSMVTLTHAAVPSGQLRGRLAWAAGVTTANTTRTNRASCVMDLGFDSTVSDLLSDEWEVPRRKLQGNQGDPVHSGRFQRSEGGYYPSSRYCRDSRGS